MKKFLLKNKYLVAILLLAFLFRSYKSVELFMYSHDQDLLGWFVKDVVVNKNLRLIGQETSTHGIYIGPLFYYLMIPSYLIFNMNPLGGLYFVILIGVFAVYSFYFVFTKIFNQTLGLIASLVYATSFYTVLTDRELVPTMPVMMLSAWVLYSLFLILKNKQKFGFILLGLLVGISWNFNIALLILTPLGLLALLLSKKKLNIKFAIYGAVTAIVTASPIVAFEIRHNFQQVSALAKSLGSSSVPGQTGELSTFSRVTELLSKNITSILWGPSFKIPDQYGLYFLLIIFAFLIYKKIISKKLTIIFVSWLFLYIAFFTANSVILSEYYLNGMNVIWIGIFSIFIYFVFTKNKILSYLLITAFLIINTHRLITIPINKSGYIYRRQIISEIKSDAAKHNYPCISISYITEPGNDFGYRYLFFLENMHVNKPSNESPVYTIVFPHSMVDRLDNTFGALGLIYPDYGKYNEEEIAKSCSGANSNLTDPLFGFN